MVPQAPHTSDDSDITYKILLVIGDVILLYLALWLALSLRYAGIDWLTFLEHTRPFTVIYALWLVLFYTGNLYNLVRLRDQLNIYFDLTRALLLGTVIAVIIFYVLPYSDLTPKRLLVIDAAIFGVLAAIWRAWFIRAFKNYLPTNNVAIIGITLRSLELGRELLKRPHSGYRLVVLAGDSQQPITTPPRLEQVEIIDNPRELLSYIKSSGINTLVIASSNPNQALINQLFEYLPLRIKFYNLADFYEELTYKIPVAQLRHTWFLNNIDEANKQSHDLIKRLIDILASFILLIAFFPLMAASALLIILDSRGSIIYTQKRMGHKNKLFDIYKLRTMVQDAEIAGAQWSQQNDSRITQVGKFLRKSRLDEIPQLMNILRGEMSLTGPRPERPEFVTDLTEKIPFYQVRHLAKPGLTGWAQVKFSYGASVKDSFEKLQYDLYYIKHRSLSLDISIWIRTIMIVLGFKGR